jgi:GNAT superfamily N-acetyltransferase
MDLHHLFVAETHQSHGIGSALIRAAMAKARAEGCARLTVGTAPNNPSAASFYPRHGFAPHTPAGTRFWLPLTTARP